MKLLTVIYLFLRGLLSKRLTLAAENLALRQQLAVWQRSAPRPRLHWRDRVFWVWLAGLWSGWQSALVIVSPATVVRWHRQGFKYYWRWKSRGQPGRPTIPRDVIALIRRMAKQNTTWGAHAFRPSCASWVTKLPNRR